ncbi:MAG: ATP-dependent DNA helicase [Victivallaceae bacterium]|nr:ATP-dependent DNA helicase [Victivallaceae bacterium]
MVIDVPAFPDFADVDYQPDPEDRSENENSASPPRRSEGAGVVEKTEEFFRPGGILSSRQPESEFRPQQLDMALATARALATGSHLAVEAPTGVGKSFAYLVPLIYRSCNGGYPAVVATATINLQEQLMEHDLLLLRKLSGVTFKAVLAKGRGNYLCKRRLALLSGDRRDALLRDSSAALMDRVESWSSETNAGERDEIRLPSEIWGQICSESGNCRAGQCPFFRGCFYFKARQEWESAHIIVANHALFLTDLRLRMEGEEGGSLLPRYGAVVIDEAHELEDSAAEHLGMRISRAGIGSILNSLYNAELGRGLLARGGEREMKLRAMIAQVRSETFAFFHPAEEFLRENNAQSGIRRVFTPGIFPDTLSEPLKELYKALSEYLDCVEDASMRTEIESRRNQIGDAIDGLGDFLEMRTSTNVYYVESERSGVALKSALLEVAEVLRERLFNREFPVILSSATLTVKKKFDYFAGRIGFENGETLQLDSPFSSRQAKILVPRQMPDPQTPEYEQALPEMLLHYLMLTHGKAFVLFTSYSSMKSAADVLRPQLEELGIRLLLQGGELTRADMIRQFKIDVDSVIFGTDSFWTGVDVPGEALSNVIIAKLPFAVPDHPLVQARCEKITLEGKSPFRCYTLPEAVLKFRQGAGRLIRSRNDSGIIVMLDHRVLSKSYGKNFLESLPYPVEIQ